MVAAQAKPRVLILSASMGGGHMQVAKELERRFRCLGCPASVVDILDTTPRWGPFVRWFYAWMVDRAPWLYDFVYRHFFLAPQSHAERASIPVRLSIPRLRRLLAAAKPDLVVSTYHLAGVAAARLRATGRLRAPAVTFITTFGVHDLWLHPGTDLYLCITSRAARQVSARSSAPVEVCEPVVRPGFAFRPEAAPAIPRPRRDRRRPGRERKVALVVAGSLGLGPVKEAVHALVRLPGWRPVAACGKNEKLRKEVGSIPGADAIGWTDDMATVMADADVVIDNAAGSTAKEALSLGRPVITFRPISGHGRHDASMMELEGAGEVVDNVAGLAGVLQRALSESRHERVTAGRALFGTDPAELLVKWFSDRAGTWEA